MASLTYPPQCLPGLRPNGRCWRPRSMRRLRGERSLLAGRRRGARPTWRAYSSTACRSNVDRLIDLRTSAVAVCCMKRLAQFVEQTRVLDGDDGLLGETADQLNLLLGERPHLLAVNGDCTNGLLLFQHWHHEQRADAADIYGSNRQLLAIAVRTVLPHIGNVNCFPEFRRRERAAGCYRDETRRAAIGP